MMTKDSLCYTDEELENLRTWTPDKCIYTGDDSDVLQFIEDTGRWFATIDPLRAEVVRLRLQIFHARTAIACGRSDKSVDMILRTEEEDAEEEGK